MARKRKETEKVEEVEKVEEETTTTYENILEVTEDFIVEDVSDTIDTTDVSNLQDLNVTEVEAAIEVNPQIKEITEEEKPKRKNQKITQGKAPENIPVRKFKPQVQKATSGGIRSTQGLFHR